MPWLEVEQTSKQIQSIGRREGQDHVPECRVCENRGYGGRAVGDRVRDAQVGEPDGTKGHVDHQECEEDHGGGVQSFGASGTVSHTEDKDNDDQELVKVLEDDKEDVGDVVLAKWVVHGDSERVGQDVEGQINVCLDCC